MRSKKFINCLQYLAIPSDTRIRVKHGNKILEIISICYGDDKIIWIDLIKQGNNPYPFYIDDLINQVNCPRLDGFNPKIRWATNTYNEYKTESFRITKNTIWVELKEVVFKRTLLDK